MRGGGQGERQRCRHSWPHTLPGQREDRACLVYGRAGCVPGACGTLGPGAVRWACPGGGLPVEGSSAGSLFAGNRAVQLDAAPADLK